MHKVHIFENPWDENEAKNGNDRTNDIDAIVKKLYDRFSSIFKSNKDNSNRGEHGGNRRLKSVVEYKNIISVMILLLTGWFLTGFFTIDTNEEGIVLLLGQYSRTVSPGLHYHIPYPFESVEKINVTRLNKEVIGSQILQDQNRTDSSQDYTQRSLGLISSRISRSFNNNRGELKEEGTQEKYHTTNEDCMLTGDENMIDLRFFVQWYVKDAKSYLFNIKDDSDTNTVKSVAESAMREVIGSVKLYDALSEKREFVEKSVKEALQRTLDSYGAGIQIDSLGILYSYVAPEVMDAYRDVQSAKADKEREINSAYAYRNDIIPRARGQAAAIIEKANAYSESVITNAKGEASRYNAVYEQYKNAKEVTKQRIYIDTITKVLTNTNKVLLDQKQSNLAPLPVLRINDLIPNNNKDATQSIVNKTTNFSTNLGNKRDE